MSAPSNLTEILAALKEYNGPDVRLMEICGTHTASIVKEGISSLLSDKIKLISGPGCPVCVTMTSYIDALIRLAEDPGNVLCCFGDLMRVPGSRESLAEAKARGLKIRMLYAPAQMLSLAEEDRAHTYIFAAVGFETTAPVYALVVKEAIRLDLNNVRLATSIKVMPPVVEAVLAEEGEQIDGFIAPGHVCTVMGAHLFDGIAQKHGIPFVVAGFSGPQLIAAIYRLIQLRGMGITDNFYTRAVEEQGNTNAQELINTYFEPCSASWRGLGSIKDSGMKLRSAFASFDADIRETSEDIVPAGCCCAKILTGKMKPFECGLFGKKCSPDHPAGACMVSQEGACFNYYISAGRGK